MTINEQSSVIHVVALLFALHKPIELHGVSSNIFVVTPITINDILQSWRQLLK
jgi:hypothetical protein